MTIESEFPLVSVGMIVRNCAHMLHPALRSVLAQTYQNWELIVIDDGSSDGTPEVVRQYADPRIRLVLGKEQRGLPERLNQAIDLARGEYFARMDGDDVCFPERFERQIRFLLAHPDIDLLGTGGVVFFGDGYIKGLRPVPTSHHEICVKPWAGFHLAHPSWMGRISWFRRYRYDVRASKAQDYDLLLRAYEKSRFAALPEALIGYREERLSRRKNLTTRRHVVAAQWRQMRRQNGYGNFLRGVSGQVVKSLIEFVVIGTPAEKKILGHRALPVDAETSASWTTFWSQLVADSLERGKTAPCAD